MTEEVLPQYEFAESYQENGTAYRTSPAPFGGTLPKGEGFGCAINYNFYIPRQKTLNNIEKCIKIIAEHFVKARFLSCAIILLPWRD